jgi:flavin reductase (DIM6/NTAB) family NADH-FMN oxidoreductase RutF
MKHFSKANIQSWERFYRSNFINCLSGFKSATLIGTINNVKQTNLSIFSNIVHLGADPATIGFINRPKEAAPHTIKNIGATGVYTMNHIHKNFIKQAHQTSAKYTEGESEFENVGLTMEWKDNCRAPFVAESRVKYSMVLREIIPIKHNGTFLVVGAVEDIFVDENIIDKDGFLRIEKEGSITTLGIDGYYETDLIARFKYAKPGVETEKIK